MSYNVSKGWSRAWRHVCDCTKRRNRSKDKKRANRRARRVQRQDGRIVRFVTERDVI